MPATDTSHGSSDQLVYIAASAIANEVKRVIETENRRSAVV
jgi:hypothetical protein